MISCSPWKQGSDRLVTKRSVPSGHLLGSQQNLSLVLQGGGLSNVLKDSLLSHYSWNTSLPFCHTTFKITHATLTLPQKTLHFYTLFCAPLNRKNKLTDSLFFEQFPDLLEYCHSLSGNSFILRELNFHYDCPLNSNTI